MTPEDVRAAAAAWLWIPDSATTVRTEELLLIRFPDWFEHPLELSQFTPRGDLGEAVDEVLARAGELDTPTLWWWVGPSSPEGVEELLLARGGVLDETLDVLALDLTGAEPPQPPEDGLELRWTDDVPTVRDSQRVGVEVFGGSMPPEDRLVTLAEEGARDLAAGRGGSLVAYVDGEPVGAAGLTLADGVARLWGGSVRAAYRRRGVYRALLAARLAHALDHGARMALVKGRVETSGPILRRAGFAAYGQERSYRLPLR